MSEVEALAAERRWARPFNLTTVEGICYHGVEFPPTGIVVLANEQGLMSAHASLDQLLAAPDMADAIVERPEEARHGV